jgi:hypothetical protein
VKRLSIALVHHPCVDKNGEVYTTSITNLDVHDIARASRTFELDAYYLVTPVKAQQDLAGAIAGFWKGSKRAQRVPSRAEALSRVRVAVSIEDAIAQETEALGHKPTILSTSAVMDDDVLSFAEGRARLEEEDALLLFGTGYGLAPEALALCDVRLAPVNGPGDYNHLSVRTAVAIILDRLRGDRD